MLQEYDIIVVGGGHAGCEAAAAAANMGSKVLLISMDLTKLAQLSCNPAMGGIAKGQILREIDALGGLSALVTDKSTIQFRMLNKSKGPAMWSPRAQCDRFIFTKVWRDEIEKISNLSLWQDNVTSLLFKGKRVVGVRTKLGIEIYSKSVILTNGTFLSGLIHVGEVSFEGGRMGEQNSIGITEQLKTLGFNNGRMKTGTPIRIDGRTVDYSKLLEQKSDEEIKFFSYLTTEKNNLKQKSCFIANTDKKVHEILKTGFDFSPLLKGKIKGIGPRYCPSIEDKLRTFAEKDSHHLFLEPEGEDTYEMYLNGFSSSLPADIQYKALKAVSGFENVHILRPGYAIEYDYFDPTQLKPSLETKLINNLYFAGQINGTTGYEEAAAQGLMAGINAHNKLNGKPLFSLNRKQAYIGVLTDDLITKGVDEPYRMFTSRSEHRVLLRQDNADERLTEIGKNIGLVTQERYNVYLNKSKLVNDLLNYIIKTSIKPKEINTYLTSIKSQPIKQSKKLKEIIIRPEIFLNEIKIDNQKVSDYINSMKSLGNDILESVEIKIKYEGYIERETLIADKINRLDHIKINGTFNYNLINSISTEARQKLEKIKPETIGQARRIPGVSPNDINILLTYLGR